MHSKKRSKKKKRDELSNGIDLERIMAFKTHYMHIAVKMEKTLH